MKSFEPSFGKEKLTEDDLKTFAKVCYCNFGNTTTDILNSITMNRVCMGTWRNLLNDVLPSIARELKVDYAKAENAGAINFLKAHGIVIKSVDGYENFYYEDTGEEASDILDVELAYSSRGHINLSNIGSAFCLGSKISPAAFYANYVIEEIFAQAKTKEVTLCTEGYAFRHCESGTYDGEFDNNEEEE